MDAREAEAAGLNTAVGVVLGQKRNEDLLRFGGDAHIMVFAPSGAGKGIGFVQPNLHDYPGSLVCLDPKGENTIVAAERRRRMGQKVIILDPFGMTGQKSDTYNPLGALTYADGANVGPWIECLAEPCPQSKRSRNQDPAVPNGLLLLRRKTPLPRRSVAYFCSGAHTRPQPQPHSELHSTRPTRTDGQKTTLTVKPDVGYVQNNRPDLIDPIDPEEPPPLFA